MRKAVFTLCLLASALSLADAFAPSAISRVTTPKAASFSAIKPLTLRSSKTSPLSSVKMGFFDALKDLAMPTEVADMPNVAPTVAAAEGALTWTAGVSEIEDPRHPMEDAWFASERDFGVFDGVTGAAKASFGDVYSFQLSGSTFSNMQRQRENMGRVNPELALEGAAAALADAKTVGSSTACAVTVDTTSQPGFTILDGVNIGDSGVVVVRQTGEGQRPEMAYKTVPQMHYFNCPFQLGGASPDTPDQATKIKVPLVSGDIVVIASDGLYDNVYDSQIIDLLEATAGQDPNVQAQALVAYARQVQEDPAVMTPYGVDAAQNGQTFVGGKLDDTVALVVQFQ
mmetsp:Transcript_63135/g.131275  ORF Transcript_63135/g.131275 Transcript_63135/m.131275 type:complete len:342 (+) Transcript_63135:12-1037(+)